jgi:hypothetical protein
MSPQPVAMRRQLIYPVAHWEKDTAVRLLASTVENDHV